MYSDFITAVKLQARKLAKLAEGNYRELCVVITASDTFHVTHGHLIHC